MTPLPPEDAFHVSAADGWLDLCNWSEADAQLEHIAPGLRNHPEVLELRCRIYAAAKKWDDCLVVAETLTDQMPNRPAGWLMLAAAEHGLGMTADAYETLCAVGEQFAELPEVTMQLARYAAILGNWQQCEDWLSRALDVGGKELRLKAMDDPLLKDFWVRAGKV